MNIFVLDKNLELNARYHVDRHVVKMITEYAQLLSGAVRLSGIDAGYKLTHKNHPCSIWVRESLDNWCWLREMSTWLNLEYRIRYKHFSDSTDHKSFTVIQNLPMPNITSKGITTRPQAMPDDVKHADTVIAYRQYYAKYKRHIASWKGREIPEFMK